MSPVDRQNGRYREFHENFQRLDAVSNRQILRTDSRETWPLQTKRVPSESSFESAIEVRNTLCQTDAGVRWQPSALALAAFLDKTIVAQGRALARRTTGSHSELRNCQFQVPKNRKVFRRIFWMRLEADGCSSRGHPKKRYIDSTLWCNFDQ